MFLKIDLDHWSILLSSLQAMAKNLILIYQDKVISFTQHLTSGKKSSLYFAITT